jgi:hypothetical protein
MKAMWKVRRENTGSARRDEIPKMELLTFSNVHIGN